eukprot:1189090-Prorocentrum_minimum.AAC.1
MLAQRECDGCGSPDGTPNELAEPPCVPEAGFPGKRGVDSPPSPRSSGSRVIGPCGCGSSVLARCSRRGTPHAGGPARGPGGGQRGSGGGQEGVRRGSVLRRFLGFVRCGDGRSPGWEDTRGTLVYAPLVPANGCNGSYSGQVRAYLPFECVAHFPPGRSPLWGDVGGGSVGPAVAAE